MLCRWPLQMSHRLEGCRKPAPSCSNSLQIIFPGRPWPTSPGLDGTGGKPLGLTAQWPGAVTSTNRLEGWGLVVLFHGPARPRLRGPGGWVLTRHHETLTVGSSVPGCETLFLSLPSWGRAPERAGAPEGKVRLVFPRRQAARACFSPPRSLACDPARGTASAWLSRKLVQASLGQWGCPRAAPGGWTAGSRRADSLRQGLEETSIRSTNTDKAPTVCRAL